MALVPSDIGSSLTQAGTATGDIFTQAASVVQTVGSIWDAITGKADATKPAAVVAPTPAPAPIPAPAPAAEPGLTKQTTYVLIGAGVLLAIVLLGMRR